eukprot:scpid107837/ scgid27001/ 
MICIFLLRLAVIKHSFAWVRSIMSPCRLTYTLYLHQYVLSPMITGSSDISASRFRGQVKQQQSNLSRRRNTCYDNKLCSRNNTTCEHSKKAAIPVPLAQVKQRKQHVRTPQLINDIQGHYGFENLEKTLVLSAAYVSHHQILNGPGG